MGKIQEEKPKSKLKKSKELLCIIVLTFWKGNTTKRMASTVSDDLVTGHETQRVKRSEQ